MGLLQKLQSLLGIGDSDADARSTEGRDGGVTIERKRGQDAAETSTDSGAPTEEGTTESTTGSSDEDVGEDEDAEAEDVADEPIVEAESEPADEADETEDATVESDETAESTDTDEAAKTAAAGTDASSSTDAMTEVPDDVDEAAEPAEATGPTTEDATPEASKVPDDHSQEPVDVIKGIGPAYADRLEGAGVETVADLATADADSLSEDTDISAKRLQGWIDRAEVR
ncbi:helix-hairpin-helix domain-containing protein [Natronosalvus caseinilyticus]|uniref:helix-hairpin-helix domain-containing protein n=1 Tax=Natronosalvus caseinilyticus TaxID=2953747 RepID=UPI0028AF2811|nr:helix-hairpin-helix domain-containing protein [Natronosalvus caseinilyticus]